jgi:hypothetical protein
MTRKDLLSIALVAFLIVLISILWVALSPIWLTVGMINPKVFSPVSELVTQKMTRQLVRGMISRAG